MALLGSEESGLGSVETAAGEKPGGGGIEELTSTDHSVTITNPSGPIADLSTAAASAPPASAITGLAFPVISGTPTLTAGTNVVFPHGLQANGVLQANDGANISGGPVDITSSDIELSGTTLIAGALDITAATDINGAVHAHAGAPVQIDDHLQVNGGADINGSAINLTSAAIGINGNTTVTGATEIENLTLDDPIVMNGTPPAAPPNVASSSSHGTSTDAARSDHTHGQVIVAEWPLGATNRRLFLVDPSGSDTNPGFLDSPVAFPLSGATVAATAKKTLAGLATVFPTQMAGRVFELIIGSATYTDSLQSFMPTIEGIPGGCVVRGTVTNSTAGSTAFAGNLADAIMAGYMTARGMNSGGYNPTGTLSATVIQCLKVGGAAPGFTAEPALPDGVRIRFDSATATAALRNICREVIKSNGSDTVSLAGTGLPAVPAAGDVFYIEEGGVISPAPTLDNTGGINQELNLVGLRFTGALTLRYGGFNLVGVGGTGLTTSSVRSLAAPTGYTHPTLGFITSGGGFRCEGSATVGLTRSAFDGFVVTGSLSNVNPAQTGCVGPCTVGGGWIHGPARGVSDFTVGIGNSAVDPIPPRIVGPASEGGLRISGGCIAIEQLDITNCGGLPAVRIEGVSVLDIGSNAAVVGPAITGSTGNTDVGLDLQLGRGAVVIVSSVSPPTVTGSLGDVRLAGGLIVSWATIVAGGGITDLAGNRIIVGPNGVSVNSFSLSSRGTIPLSGTLQANGSTAVASYLANAGPGEGGNQASPNLYPSGFRVFTGLRVVVNPGDSLTTSCTATLYKTSPSTGTTTITTMTVTIPAGSATGFQIADVAHPQLFVVGDAYDVRLDAASGTASTGIGVAVSLEYAD
jgi:fibronectin-binding autotransporter adhesin